jgi:hypothetical protein
MNAARSTKPSSSPEFGTPSGPSLSNAPKLTEPSTAASECWRKSAVLPKMLELPAP